MSVYRKGPIRRSELWSVSQVLLDFPAHSPSFVLLLRSLFVGLDAESRMPELRRGPSLPRSLAGLAGTTRLAHQLCRNDDGDAAPSLPPSLVTRREEDDIKTTNGMEMNGI